jgi:hypothetical protein
MKNGDPEGLDELAELLGPLDFKDEHQAERGALPVAKQAADSLVAWLKREADWQPTLAELLESRGLPAPLVDDKTMTSAERLNRS